jgi:hypothetical protein
MQIRNCKHQVANKELIHPGLIGSSANCKLENANCKLKNEKSKLKIKS